jgi:N-acetylneuraminate synthase/N,N'-diacetyllegionaminate synthase
LTDRFLLSCVAALRLPVLLSTGGATLAEVRSACHVVCEAGNPPLALLHCVSAYPASSDEVNLRALDVLRHTFNVPVGFSDHTPDILASIIAVARGSAILEKHLTLDRTLPGPDHAFSLEPEALRLLVNELRRTERALGDGAKQPSPAERPIMAVARKSMFAARRIERGAVITRDDLVALRPAGGMSPMDADCLIGALAVEAIEGGTLMRPDMVERARSRR